MIIIWPLVFPISAAVVGDTIINTFARLKGISRAQRIKGLGISKRLHGVVR